jgi:hypothetical protein
MTGTRPNAGMMEKPITYQPQEAIMEYERTFGQFAKNDMMLLDRL